MTGLRDKPLNLKCRVILFQQATLQHASSSVDGEARPLISSLVGHFLAYFKLFDRIYYRWIICRCFLSTTRSLTDKQIITCAYFNKL